MNWFLPYTVLAAFLLAGCDRPPQRTTVARSATSASLPESPKKPATSLPALDPQPDTVEYRYLGISYRDFALEVDSLLENAKGLPQGERRDAKLSHIISKLSETDPDRAVRELIDWKEALAKPWCDAASRTTEALWKRDPASAARLVAEHVPRSMQAEVWRLTFAKANGPEAAAWFHVLPEGTARLQVAANVINRWITTAPVAAAAWADSIVASLSEEEAAYVGRPNYTFGENTDGEFRKMTPLEKVAATHLAFANAKHPLARRMFAKTYLEEVGRALPEQLAEITAKVEAEIAGVTMDALIHQISDDPAGYAHALTRDEVRALPDEVKYEIQKRWTEKDAKAASEWLAEARFDEQLYYALYSWSSIDPAAAVAFALKQPPGKERDSFFASRASHFFERGESAQVEASLAAISDPEARKRIQEGLKRLKKTKE